MKKLIIILCMLVTCSCFAQPIKFYFAVDQTADRVKIKEWFKKYNVEYHVINKRGGYIFANALIRDHKDIPNLQSVFNVEGFTILAAFKQNGEQVGRTKIMTTQPIFSENGMIISEAEYEYEGTPTYKFSKTTYINLMKDIITHDNEGNIISSVRPTIEREEHNYLGWGKAIFPKDE